MQDLFWDRQMKKTISGRRGRLKMFSQLAIGAFFFLVAAVLGFGLLLAWYAKDLPRPDKVRRQEGLSTVILDRNGDRIYDIFQDENRIPVTWENIPTDLKNATIAVEDKDFYKHKGLSERGILRALINIFVFRNFQGGSTLTQQLVKNALLTQERTLPRKIKEAILAIQIENKYTKNEILQMYLNEAPYGGTAVGVEAAAQYYFGKNVRELTRIEAVILAGLPQSPTRYSPFTGEDKAYVWRAEQVARRMREDGYITGKEEDEIKKALPAATFASPAVGLKAPHFVAFVKEQLISKFGSRTVDAGGLTVTTSLDLALQEKAQQIVASEVDKAKKLQVSNGAAVVINPKTGEILAMVGSKDYAATDSGGFKFNVATQGLRQPGSTMKPITYAAAFRKGYTPATVLLDVDTKYPSGDPKKPEYNPKNYDGKYRGPMQLRYALGNSINTIAVKVSALVGIRDVLHTAYEMGLSTLEPTDENLRRFGLSLTLGGGEVTLLELTSAFGVFANSGLRADPTALLKVEDAKGKVLFQYQPPQARQVLPADISFLVSNILSDNDARKEIFGPRSLLVIPGKTVAVKTGTTDDKRDNWTVGYTPSVVVGVWVGNNDNSPMHPSLASGITGASPIWSKIMIEALKGKSDEPFERPDTITDTDIDGFGGGTPQSGYPTRREFFVRGTEPTGPGTVYRQVKISKHEGDKLANAVEIAKGEFELKTYVVFTESDPVSTDGKNRWQEGIDQWVAREQDQKYHPPRDTYQGVDQVAVIIKEPSDMQQINGPTIQVTAEATSLSEVTKIEVFVDGTKVKEVSGKSLSDTVSVTDGSHLLKVKATDNKNNTSEREVHIGINQPYATPTPTLMPTPTP